MKSHIGKNIIIFLCLSIIIATEVTAKDPSQGNSGSLFEKRTREYSNIVISWKPGIDEPSLQVMVTMGSALIGVMNFTPDTIKQKLNYSNPPQSVSGIFIVEFNGSGNGGKLYSQNLTWKTLSDEGNITSLIGVWQVND